MRIFLLQVALCLAVTGLHAQQLRSQQEKFQSMHLYNAYAVAREMIKMERQLAAIPPGKDSTVKDQLKDSIRSVLGSLVWYADLQDTDPGQVTSGLVTKLEYYSRLKSLYISLSGKLYVFKFLDEKDIEGVKRYFNVTPAEKRISGHEKAIADLCEKLQPYFTVKANFNIKDAEQDRKLKRKDNLTKDSNDLAVRINNFRNSPDPTQIDTAKANLLERDSVSRVSQQLNDLRKELASLHEEIADLLKRSAMQRDSVVSALTQTTDPKLIELLSKAANIDESKYVKEVTGYETALATSQSNYSQSKADQAIILEQSSLSFRLPSEAEMIDAIAVYLAKRVKQEAVMWFFETVQKNANQYTLIKTFFPNTVTLLQSNEVYEIPNLGAQWRYALSKDFLKLPRNVLTSDWFNNWYNKKVKANKQLPEYLLAAFEACDLLSQQYNYSQFVKQMYLNLHNRPTVPSNEGIVTPANLFAILYAFNQECFIPVYKGDTLINTRLMRYEDFRNVTRDELEIMISLMDMKYSHAFGALWYKATGKRFLEGKDGEDFRRWAGSIETGIEQFNKLQAEYVKLTNEIKEGKKLDGAYTAFNIWDNINVLFNLVMPDTTVSNTSLKKIAQGSAELKKNAAKAFEIYRQLSLKNYTGAVNTTISLVEDLLYNNKDSVSLDKARVAYLLKPGDTFKKHYLPKIDSTTSLSFTQNQIVSSFVFEKDRHAINIVRKLAGFLNDVMLTTNAEQLSKVVESYALPPGSYKRKRNSWLSVDLNAYVGGYYGRERLSGVEKSWGNVYGITAPIGLSISRTFGKKLLDTADFTEDLIRNPDKVRIGKNHIWKRGTSTFTFALTLVDIGAVVSYRFSNTAQKGLPQEVSWAQVLSPGVRLAYGIRNTPLVASIGYQYTPKLREINQNGETMYSTHRISAGILFDLPLANLWQRSYWKGKYNN
jgi:hypothetical protein